MRNDNLIVTLTLGPIAIVAFMFALSAALNKPTTNPKPHKSTVQTVFTNEPREFSPFAQAIIIGASNGFYEDLQKWYDVHT